MATSASTLSASPIIATDFSLDSIYASASSFIESVEDWTKENSQIATITAVALAVLGITILFVVGTLVVTIAHAAIVGIAATSCFAACCAIGYFLVRQALSTFHPHTVEDVVGSPPNIELSDSAGQASYRVQVMNDTLNHLKAGFYTSPNGNRQTLDLNAAAQGAELLLHAGPIIQRPGNEQTRILVKNKDCLYAAAELHARGLNPIVLDMANDRHFGGGYLTGASAQEEDCCRRSGLCLAVDTQQGLQRQNFYPLHRNSESAGVYVPRVPIFRAGFDKGYQYLNHPFEIAYGVFAAYHHPQLSNASGAPRLHHTTAAATREKIRTFFEMARQKGHHSVVFSAFGCGAFRNPPDQIAEITMDVISNEFAHCFKEIVIAVIDDHNAGHAHNPEGNFNPFARQVLSSGGKAFDANGQELTTI